MKICIWALYLVDNAFKMGFKSCSDYLGDHHILIESCYATLVPAFVCFHNHFVTRSCYSKCWSLTEKEDRRQENSEMRHLCPVNMVSLYRETWWEIQVLNCHRETQVPLFPIELLRPVSLSYVHSAAQQISIIFPNANVRNLP